MFCHKLVKVKLYPADAATTCGQKCAQMAGPQTFSTYVSDCDVINAGAICPPSYCENTSYATLPTYCQNPNAFKRGKAISRAPTIRGTR